jgi:hypothetical protein
MDQSHRPACRPVAQSLQATGRMTPGGRAAGRRRLQAAPAASVSPGGCPRCSTGPLDRDTRCGIYGGNSTLVT